MSIKDQGHTLDDGFKAPKRVTSWRTCPACGSRATKIFHLSSRDDEPPYQCQVCDHRYFPPEPRI